MKTLCAILAALLFSCVGYGQQATVTATIASYAGGSVIATFQQQGGGSPPASQQQVSSSINSSGSFSLLVWNNAFSGYAPSATVFNICASGSNPSTCYSATVRISSSSQDISSAFTSAPTPPGASTTVTATSPVVATTTGNAVVISCPTCGTGTGSGTVNSATAFATAYYPATGIAVSGTTPFNGFQVDSTTVAPRVGVQADFNAFLLAPGPIGTTTPSIIDSAPGSTMNGDATSTPSTLMQVTATNSGSTTGIPSGYSCIVQHVFDSGTNYDALATCKAPNAGRMITYFSGSHALGSESYTQVASLTSGGQYIAAGAVTGSNVFAPTAATATPSTGVTSVTCATAACTSQRGTYSVVGGTATTGSLATISWTATTTAQVCLVSQNGNGATGTSAVFVDLGHTVATTTGFTLNSAISVLGLTVTFDYICTP